MTFDDGDGIAERELVRQALDDPAAFQRLYERYFGRVYGYVASRVADQHDAEDIVSDVFLRVVRHLPQLRNSHQISFAAWLFTIARNAVTDHHRRKPQTETHLLLELAAPLAATELSHDAAVIAGEDAALLRNLIAALPERKREIVTLRYYGGLRNQEIAALLHIRERTVAATLSRALDELQEKYSALNPEVVRKAD